MYRSAEENSESTWQIYLTWVIENIFLPDNKIEFLQIETIMEIRLLGWWWRKPWSMLTTFETGDELISESWEASAIDVEEAHGSFKKAGASSKVLAFLFILSWAFQIFETLNLSFSVGESHWENQN